MTKKAYLQITYFMMIVMMLLVIFTFSAFFYKYKNKFEQKAYNDACNQYLQLHLFSKKGVFDVDMNDFPCKTEDVVISIDETKSEGLQKYDIMQDVSENMVACANSYSRGEQELFAGKNDETVRFCAACHKIRFVSDTRPKIETLELLGFQSTIKTDSSETFSDILGTKDFTKGFMDHKDYFEEKLEGDITIDTNKEYLTVFTYDKKEAKTLWQKIVNGAEKGALVGTVVVVGGVIIYFSAGSATPGVLAVAGGILTATKVGIVGGAVAGGGISYVMSKESQNGAVWISTMELVEFDDDKLRELECETIIGMQEPGITSRVDD